MRRSPSTSLQRRS